MWWDEHMSSARSAGIDIWGEDDNAVRYGEFARMYPGYRETSRDLVALASPDRGATVLDLASTATSVRSVLAVGGRFVFNVGAGFLEQVDDPNQLGELPAVMQAIAARDYAWSPPAARSASAGAARPTLSREAIRRCLTVTGFDIERVEELSYEESPEAQRAWLAVPIFTTMYLPGLPYRERMQVLAEAYAQLGAGQTQVGRWVAFAATAASGRR